MNNKKYLIVPAFALMALLAAAGTASAYGGRGNGLNADQTVWAKNFEERMSEQAGLLGVSVADMKAAWAEGKNVHDVAKEKGISDTDLQAKMKAQRLTEMKEYLQNLVNSGSITQAQADARLKFVQDKQTQQKPGEGRRGGGKMHSGRGGAIKQK